MKCISYMALKLNKLSSYYYYYYYYYYCYYNYFIIIFRRNATHCISPYAIVMCVCVCVCLYVRLCLCVCVCMPRLWTSGKRFEIGTPFFFKIAQNDIGHNL